MNDLSFSGFDLLMNLKGHSRVPVQRGRDSNAVGGSAWVTLEEGMYAREEAKGKKAAERSDFL